MHFVMPKMSSFSVFLQLFSIIKLKKKDNERSHFKIDYLI